MIKHTVDQILEQHITDEMVARVTRRVRLNHAAAVIWILENYPEVMKSMPQLAQDHLMEGLLLLRSETRVKN